VQDHQDPRALLSDDAATKLIWLALRNITANWRRAAKEWKEALYAERFEAACG